MNGNQKRRLIHWCWRMKVIPNTDKSYQIYSNIEKWPKMLSLKKLKIFIHCRNIDEIDIMKIWFRSDQNDLYLSRQLKLGLARSREQLYTQRTRTKTNESVFLYEYL